MEGGLVIAAGLFAMVAFQAALAPPGGVWLNEYVKDNNGNLVRNPYVGKSVFGCREPKLYVIFVILDVLAFVSSFAIVLFYVSDLNRRMWIWLLIISMLSIVGMLFIILLVHFSP